MINTTHNPLLDGGGWRIESEPPSHKKDRAQAILYVLRGTRGMRRRTPFTTAETFALNHDLWIAERPSDHVDDLARPPHERPGLVRINQLWLCSGGLLVEQLEDLGDYLAQAAVISEFHRVERQVVAGNRVVTTEQLGRLTIRAGGAEAVAAAAKRLSDAALTGWNAHLEAGGRNILAVGSGEPRDLEAARTYAECLHLEGFGRAEILGRLNLDGFMNKHERRRWNTHNYPVATS